ncbi:MAG: hypothetical protein ABI760_00880 [Ferruginibacter sp.]
MNMLRNKENSSFGNLILLERIMFIAGLLTCMCVSAQQMADPVNAANPVIENKYTADPAALVHGDSVYLYAGQDEGLPGKDGYIMHKEFIFKKLLTKKSDICVLKVC